MPTLFDNKQEALDSAFNNFMSSPETRKELLFANEIITISINLIAVAVNTAIIIQLAINLYPRVIQIARDPLNMRDYENNQIKIMTLSLVSHELHELTKNNPSLSIIADAIGILTALYMGFYLLKCLYDSRVELTQNLDLAVKILRDPVGAAKLAAYIAYSKYEHTKREISDIASQVVQAAGDPVGTVRAALRGLPPIPVQPAQVVHP